MVSHLTQFLRQPSIAVDLGTANTRLYTCDGGKTIEQPSSINLVDRESSQVSDEYFQYINSKLVATPLRGGVIVDLKNAVTLLKPLVLPTRKLFMRPLSLACAPTDTTAAERNLLCRALLQAGASRVSVIPEVWAAAIGAGLDISLPQAQMLIDIGEGVTDLALFRDGQIVCVSAIRTACSDLHKAIRSTITAKYKLKLYDHEVQRLTEEGIRILSDSRHQHLHREVAGIDIVKRRGTTLTIDSQDVTKALLPITNRICEMINTRLGKLPEKLFCQIVESGICLTGGGACIQAMDALIAVKTQMPVFIAPDPLHAVINGAMQTLNYWTGKKCWWENMTWPHLAT